MPSALALLAFFADGDLAAVFQSPFIVPVFGTLMILGIVVAGIWAGVRRREMESAERLAAIAKRVPLPPPAHETAQPHAAYPVSAAVGRPRSGIRTTGLVLTFLGIGLGVFGLLLTWIVRDRDVLAAAASGLIPLAIGIGFLIDAHLKYRDLRREADVAGHSSLGPLR